MDDWEEHAQSVRDELSASHETTGPETQYERPWRDPEFTAYDEEYAEDCVTYLEDLDADAYDALERFETMPAIGEAIYTFPGGVTVDGGFKIKSNVTPEDVQQYVNDRHGNKSEQYPHPRLVSRDEIKAVLNALVNIDLISMRSREWSSDLYQIDETMKEEVNAVRHTVWHSDVDHL